MKTKASPTELDKYIGKRLRDTGLTQIATGKIIDVSFQQIGKFWNGDNRISAGNLAKIAKHLDYPMEWFLPEEYHRHEAKRIIELEKAYQEDMQQAMKHGKELVKIVTG